MDDVERLREVLRPLEGPARQAPWADERPWGVDSHVFWQGGWPTVDGHDLKVKVFKRVLDVLVEVGPELESGAVRVVVGSGRHSRGEGPVLGQVLHGRVGPLVEERGWQIRPRGPSIFVVIDPVRGASAGRETGLPWLWLAYLAAALLALARACGAL